MFFKTAAFVVALALPAPLAGAATLPAAHWKFENPFCDVLAAMAPLSVGSGYGLVLLAARGSSLDAHVTLVGDTDAYDAHVQQAGLTGAASDREADPILVTLPSGTPKINYFFVDSYAIDGGSSMTCPSYVFPMGTDRISASPSAAAPLAAQHLQAIAKPPCGHVYRPPDTNGDVGGTIGHFGDKPLSTKFDVYLDSKGHPISETITESSGVEGVDQSALGVIQQHVFSPAQFLCTPVVGEMSIQIDYQP